MKRILKTAAFASLICLGVSCSKSEPSPIALVDAYYMVKVGDINNLEANDTLYSTVMTMQTGYTDVSKIEVRCPDGSAIELKEDEKNKKYSFQTEYTKELPLVGDYHFSLTQTNTEQLTAVDSIAPISHTLTKIKSCTYDAETKSILITIVGNKNSSYGMVYVCGMDNEVICVGDVQTYSKNEEEVKIYINASNSSWKKQPTEGTQYKVILYTYLYKHENTVSIAASKTNTMVWGYTQDI